MAVGKNWRCGESCVVVLELSSIRYMQLDALSGLYWALMIGYI